MINSCDIEILQECIIFLMGEACEDSTILILKTTKRIPNQNLRLSYSIHYKGTTTEVFSQNFSQNNDI